MYKYIGIIHIRINANSKFYLFIYEFSIQNLRFKNKYFFSPPHPETFIPVSHIIYKWIVAVHYYQKSSLVFFLWEYVFWSKTMGYTFNYGLYIYIYFKNMDFYSNQISPENYYWYNIIWSEFT